MKEAFEARRMTGPLKIKLTRKDNASAAQYWEGRKEAVAEAILRITLAYARQGYTLSLRQLYYQLVTGNVIINDDALYRKISSIKDDLVYSGALDWSFIEDRTRKPWLSYAVTGIENSLEDTIDQYKLNRQKGQPVTLEIWSEKDAISGILRRVTSKYHVRLNVNKGYGSSSSFYSAYQRAVESLNEGRPFYIGYFGDHDPSGLDMIRDIKERIDFMLNNGTQLNATGIECFYQGFFKVVPIGLTMKQIKKYGPPENPAKLDDPRADKYVQTYGPVSWEVDALKPPVIVEIAETWVLKYLEESLYQKMLRKEERHKKALREATDKLVAELGNDSTEEDSDEDEDDE
jgi:hypothetical protein